MDASNTSSATSAGTARTTAVQHREHVQRALVALESALAEPAPQRLAEWSDAVGRRLHDLRGEFARHVEITEGPDGLYDEIVAVAPEHVHALDLLRAEHTEIEDAIRSSLASLATRGAGEADPDDWVAARRQACTTLLGRLVRHRQRGADLTWRAYHAELGSG